MEQRVSLVTLGVRDLARARAFYEALGWTTGRRPRGRRRLLPGGRDGGLTLEPRAAAEDSGVADTGGWGGVTLAHNVRSPEEVDAVMHEAEAAGATITRAAAPTFWGGFSGAFADPDGHALEIAHNPHWTLADDGSIQLSG